MVRLERQGPCAIITMNRPQARNAINSAMEQALYDALEQVDSDPDIRVGILAANGPVFCSGADLQELAAQGRPPPLQRESIVSRRHLKPLIAAVDGPALGGGAELMLACDLVVASSAAKFGLPEVRWGLLASGGGMFRLPKVLPKRVALQLLISGASISAERAYELGLINELVAPGEVLQHALTLAQRIAENGPLAIQLTMEVVERASSLTEAQAWELSRQMVARNFGSEDAKEGPRAFAEKRKPQWTGR